MRRATEAVNVVGRRRDPDDDDATARSRGGDRVVDAASSCRRPRRRRRRRRRLHRGSASTAPRPARTPCAAPISVRPRSGAAGRRSRSRPRRRLARSACMSSSPSGPQPNTPAVIPGRARPRSSACSATPSGSSSGPAASGIALGERTCKRAPGQAIERAQRAVGRPVPGEAESRQRCGMPPSARGAGAARMRRIDRDALAGARARLRSWRRTRGRARAGR